ncbi:DNA-binding response regulator [Chloroflexi bacterium TSY]|nr:DNA-binding response regulator [Chloroflexi bacterium TSY]
MHPTSPNLLLVDNDSDFVAICAEYLELVGYRVMTATSIDDARQSLHKHRIHLALFDLRLVNDTDQKDKSGLTLAREIAPSIPKLIVTKFPVHQDVRDALKPRPNRPPDVVDYIDKRWGLDELQTAIEQSLKAHLQINWTLPIRWRTPFSFVQMVQAIAPFTSSMYLQERADEFEDLFRRLFCDRRQVTIGRILLLRDDYALLEVFAYGEQGFEEQYLVSCGCRLQLITEKERYQVLALGDMGVGNCVMKEFAETMRYGAAAYMLSDSKIDEVSTLRELIRHQHASQLRSIVTGLFNNTLSPWHKQNRYLDFTELAFAKVCREWLKLPEQKLTSNSLQQQIEIICQQARERGLLHLEATKSKICWQSDEETVDSYANFVPHLDKVNYGGSLNCGFTHGGVNTESVLVNTQGNSWLTDFSRSHERPLLFDYVSFELSLKWDLAYHLEIAERIKLERYLLTELTVEPFTFTGDEERYVNSKSVEESVHILAFVRQMALDRSKANFDVYLAVFFWSTLKQLAQFDATMFYTHRELVPFVHALLSVTLIYDKLTGQHSSNQMVPPQAHTSFWIDDAQKEVWIEGSIAKVTPQEFDLLAYMYERRGRLCAREELTERVLNGVHKDKLGQSQLNSAMNRLRRKIESVAREQTYLVTVRGRGYKLVF